MHLLIQSRGLGETKDYVSTVLWVYVSKEQQDKCNQHKIKAYQLSRGLDDGTFGRWEVRKVYV